ncbi:hypothetical protein I79_018725 [Cricetulus griseus]|uniref:Uncharacterized protein n=1 Tax=Cricetulus griseus TaxID=10029 RepID=G3I5H7_CRIGR|nr:hypothetical protein I79_018725 [Cricetulus griseus]
MGLNLKGPGMNRDKKHKKGQQDRISDQAATFYFSQRPYIVGETENLGGAGIRQERGHLPGM